VELTLLTRALMRWLWRRGADSSLRAPLLAGACGHRSRVSVFFGFLGLCGPGNAARPSSLTFLVAATSSRLMRFEVRVTGGTERLPRSERAPLVAWETGFCAASSGEVRGGRNDGEVR
jgi:hypothetical protein